MVLEAAVILFLAGCVSALAFQWQWERWHRRRKLPPVVTLLQHVVFFWQTWRSGMHKPLMEAKEKFGPAFTLYVRFQRFVVLSGYDAVKEALVDHAAEFGSRGAMYSLERLFKGHGVILANGERWKQLRRFSSLTLKNFGMGKRSIEEQIQVEAQHLAEAIRGKKGSPFNPALLTTHAVSNITCSIVFGNRFDYEDKNFLDLMGSMNNLFLELSNQWNMLYEIYPRILQFLPGPHKRVPRIYKTLHDFILERVRINQQSLDPSCPRDYIDSFLIKMEQEKQNPLSEFHTTSLVENVIQLFIAGTETTSSTLRYGFLLLAKYPEVQDKVHEEIDRVIGQTHGPSMQHRSRMPYTNAVIHEIQRFANILPLGLLHKVACDTHFRGYFLPKDTPVCISLSTVLHDPKYFKDPERFDPGHFLDENGCFKQNDAFLPFSAGKRVCLGKSLALMELFLILTTILQRFTLTSPKPPQEINLTPKVNILVNVPPSYELYVLPRADGLQDRA